MRAIALCTLTFAAATLTGCAGSFGNTTATVAAPTTLSVTGLHGLVHGGQQPIGYATIQLYQAGATGYGTGATGLIASGSYSPGGATGCTSTGSSAAQSCYSLPVTDANGNFSITGEYTCTKGTQVYIAATAGNPTPNTPNSASGLLAGLGLCDNLGPNTNILLNEITTVGTVWALAPFMPVTGSGIVPTAIGTSSTNQAGLASAFSDINTLVSIAGGSPMPSTSSLTLPSAEINTLGNIIAACINSGGSTSSQCSGLFSNATSADGTNPTEVISAALNIARNPGRNVAALINNAPAIGAPFGPTIASANDLTLAATYTGSGIASPSGLAIDASGNVWIANAGNTSATPSVPASVTVLSHNLATANTYTAGALNAPSAIAIDLTGNAWIANGGNSTLTELSSSGANVTGSPFSGGGLSTPTSVAIDGLGNVWLSNSGNSAISEFNSSGVAQSGTSGYVVSGVSAPVAIAINTK